MRDSATIKRKGKKYSGLAPVMDERVRRQWAAAEAMGLGGGGVSAGVAATGLARNTVAVGRCERKRRRKSPRAAVSERLRRVGAGRKPVTQTDPELLRALLTLVEPVTRGPPESPRLWTGKSTAKLAEELARQEHHLTDRTVAALLKANGFSLPANRQTREGSSPPDRHAQFEFIKARVMAFATASIRHWWSEMGNLRFPHATERLITADGGGSHSRRHPAVEDLAARPGG